MSLDLDRRSFLKGLFGAAALALAPLPVAVESVDLSTWAKAVSEIYGKYISDVLIFGTAGIRTCEEFPFIRNIGPEELTMEELKQVPTGILSGMFDDHSPARQAISDAIASRVLERTAADRKVREHYHLELKT